MLHSEARRQRTLPVASLSRGLFLLAAGVSFAISVSLWFTGNELEGIFVGLWVPSILALGAMLLHPPASRS